MKYYSAVKKNEIVEFAVQWMELANMLMHPRSTKTNATYSPPWVVPNYTSSDVRVTQPGVTIETRKIKGIL